MNSAVNFHEPQEKHITVLAKEQSEDQPVAWRNERVIIYSTLQPLPQAHQHTGIFVGSKAQAMMLFMLLRS